MLNLTPENHVMLKNAFDKAIIESENNMCMSNGNDAIPPIQFASDDHDVFIGFDYNKNEEAVSKEDEEKLRFIMQIVQNQATAALSSAKKDLTHNSETWIDFISRYPLLFNFKERQSKEFEEKDFLLKVKEEGIVRFVKTFLGYEAPISIVRQLIGALRTASGPVLDITSKNEHFQYLALCRGYDKASTLTIYRVQMDMSTSEIKTICRQEKKVALFMSYDEVVFEINNMLALALYPSLFQLSIETAEKELGALFLNYAGKQYRDFENYLKSL